MFKNKVLKMLHDWLENIHIDDFNDYTFNESCYSRRMLIRVIDKIENMRDTEDEDL